MELVPCAVYRAAYSLKSKKAVMRSEEGAGMMSLVSPEYETMYLVYSVPKAGPAFLPSFSLFFIFFCNNPIHKSWRKANYLTYFLRKKKKFRTVAELGSFVVSSRVMLSRVMSCRQSGDRLFFSSSDGLSLLSVEAYRCYVYAEVTRACLTGRM